MAFEVEGEFTPPGAWTNRLSEEQLEELEAFRSEYRKTSPKPPVSAVVRTIKKVYGVDVARSTLATWLKQQ